MSWSIFATGQKNAVRNRVAGTTYQFSDPAETGQFEEAKATVLNQIDRIPETVINKGVKVEACGSHYAGNSSVKIDVQCLEFLMDEEG